MKEFPELQKQVYDKFDKNKLMVLTIGRGHDAKALKEWNAKKGYTIPVCPDKDKSIYELYFTRYIPRTVLINKEGKIILQEVGYDKKSFQHLIEMIKKEI